MRITVWKLLCFVGLGAFATAVACMCCAPCISPLVFLVGCLAGVRLSKETDENELPQKRLCWLAANAFGITFAALFVYDGFLICRMLCGGGYPFLGVFVFVAAFINGTVMLLFFGMGARMAARAICDQQEKLQPASVLV